jgi:hypothetical protein
MNVAPPIPVEGTHVVYAAGQPEYQPLPAWKHADGRLVTRWHFSWKERLRLLFGRDLFLEVMTFNQPLQPIYPSLDWFEIEEVALDAIRKTAEREAK